MNSFLKLPKSFIFLSPTWITQKNRNLFSQKKEIVTDQNLFISSRKTQAVKNHQMSNGLVLPLMVFTIFNSCYLQFLCYLDFLLFHL